MHYAGTIRNRSWYQRTRAGLVCLAALLVSVLVITLGVTVNL
jgi:hypothetical protein